MPLSDFLKKLGMRSADITDKDLYDYEERKRERKRKKDKAEAEFKRVTDMCQDFLKRPDNNDQDRVLREEREILRVKMLALSDLLAVFRSV